MEFFVRTTRTSPARVAGPVLLTLAGQLGAVAAALLAGLSAAVTLLLVVVVGIVAAVLARRTVASLVVGAGLRVAQPYVSGDRVRLYVPSMESVQDGEIVRVGPANTTVLTPAGLVQIPNAHLLLGTRP